MPMWSGLGSHRVDRVIDAVYEAIDTVAVAPAASA
jgi:hypothetical protein